MTEARRTLEARSRAVADQPVLFRAGNGRWKLTARTLEISVNWRGAVSAALRQGEGPAPVRGFRRIGCACRRQRDAGGAGVRRGAPVRARPDLDAGQSGPPRRLAAPARRTPESWRAGAGLRLDRDACRPARSCRRCVARASASLSILPVRVDPPRSRLPSCNRPPRTCGRPSPLRFSSPLARLASSSGRTGWRGCSVSQPMGAPTSASAGSTPIRSSCAWAGRSSTRHRMRISSRSREASGCGGATSAARSTARNVRGDPARRALADAALRAARLSADAAKLTTAEAKKLGIKQIVGTYTTIYGGIANRIHNVQLVAHLIDSTSSGRARSSRSTRPGRPRCVEGLPRGAGDHQRRAADRSRRRCLPGVDDRLQRRLRAGLKITSRTNHALYISHYPLGRDATVNIPIRTSALSTTPPTGCCYGRSSVVVADGDPLWDEPAPPGRERGCAADRRRAGAGEDDDGRGAARRQDRGRRRRFTCAPDER